MRKRFSVPSIASSEITPESVYLKRRDFMRGAGLAAGPALAGLSLQAQAAPRTGGAPLEYAAATPGTAGT
jgi:sulfoxide reductase catalytic subunit YedY